MVETLLIFPDLKVIKVLVVVVELFLLVLEV
jgi:hypothetical protein